MNETAQEINGLNPLAAVAPGAGKELYVQLKVGKHPGTAEGGKRERLSLWSPLLGHLSDLSMI